MKIKQLFTYCLLASTFLLASCDNETLPDGDGAGTPPLEGMYPLTFTATQNNSGGVQTRVSEKPDGNSQWSEGDVIGVRIGADTRTGSYTLNADGKIKNTNTPVYWLSTEEQTVTGWYPVSTTVNLSDQSQGLAYVLKGTARGSYNSNPTLAFTHQLAKVRVKLQGVGASKVTAVKVKGYTDCTHSEGNVTEGTTQDYILTMKNGKYYEANLVPQNIEASTFIQLTSAEKTTIIPITGGITQLDAGTIHTITLTVYTPEVDLSEQTEDFTVCGEVTIKGDGKTPFTHNITIVGDGTQVTLENIKVEENQIDVKGNATIILSGNNSVKRTNTKWAAIVIAEGKTLTINGGDTDVLDLKGNGLNNEGCLSGKGNIIINGGQITADARGMNGAGIGSGVYYRKFGDITINGGIVTAFGGANSAGIGSGDYMSSCGAITINGGTINATGGNDGAWPGIGPGASGSTCGTITIASGANVTDNGKPRK